MFAVSDCLKSGTHGRHQMLCFLHWDAFPELYCYFICSNHFYTVVCCLLSFAKFGWICAESTALYTSQFILLLTRAINTSSSGSYTCLWHNTVSTMSSQANLCFICPIFFCQNSAGFFCCCCFLLFLSFLGKPDLILLFLECNHMYLVVNPLHFHSWS